MKLQLSGRWFKDEFGRTLILRGVNLGGSSKVPYVPNGATHLPDSFMDYCNVSFVGRPFPLGEADEHLRRLKRWGLTFVRFVVTWEAIEHTGPGIYDEAYLDYVYQIVKKAGDYGITIFVDPHQDCWSRFTGGDGAPAWTLECVGMDISKIKETGAALVHCFHDGPLPRMVWPTNYSKFAASTMFTLFYGGNDFAPEVWVDGVPVQEYLQGHFIAAVQQLAMRLKELDNIVGYDSLNEPSPGLIGCNHLHDPHGMVCTAMVRNGEMPSFLQGMALASGFPQMVGIWELGYFGWKQVGRRLLNPNGVRLWREGFDCVWRRHGVWDVSQDGTPCLLLPDYFSAIDGREVNFCQDYLKPFVNRFARGIREIDARAIVFVEGVTFEPPPKWEAHDAQNVVCASHWYDVVTLYNKQYFKRFGVDIHHRRPVFGAGNVRRMLVRQLEDIKNWAYERFGDVPILVGEFGIPFDMNAKASYTTGDFSQQTQAMDASFQAMDANLLSCTLWNYTADNDNRWGDQWNEEDFSIFSRDQQKNPAHLDSGGRALDAVVRPYPRCIAGEPLQMRFDYRSGEFFFRFRHDAHVKKSTEIYLPQYHYGRGYRVEVSDGEFDVDEAEQTLFYTHSMLQTEHTILIRRAVGRA